jgi:hypothetical protein
MVDIYSRLFRTCSYSGAETLIWITIDGLTYDFLYKCPIMFWKYEVNGSFATSLWNELGARGTTFLQQGPSGLSTGLKEFIWSGIEKVDLGGTTFSQRMQEAGYCTGSAQICHFLASWYSGDLFSRIWIFLLGQNPDQVERTSIFVRLKIHNTAGDDLFVRANNK